VIQIRRLHRSEVISALILAAAALLTAGAIAGSYWFAPLPELTTIRRCADLGQWEQAQADVTRYLSRKPSDAEALMLAARVSAGRGELERCAELLDKVPATSPLKLEALLRRGQTLRRLHYARRAEDAWRELIDLAHQRGLNSAPHLFSARVELVVLMSLERRVSEGTALLWQIYPKHREKWRILITLARLAGRPANPQMALPLLEKCIDQDPYDLQARLGLARYHMELAQWQDAADQAAYCLEQDLADEPTLEILLECQFRLQLWDEMDRLLSRLDRDNGTARVWRLRGQRLEVLGEADEAEQCFRESLRLEPNNHVTHFQLSQILRRRGLGEAADQHHAEFRRLQDHDQEIAKVIASFAALDDQDWTVPDPETCTALGAHCIGLGRNDEARGWTEQALLQRPDFQPAIDQLRRLTEIDQPDDRSE
jgi:tetratricopeptide (TPR) repeat protein